MAFDPDSAPFRLINFREIDTGYSIAIKRAGQVVDWRIDHSVIYLSAGDTAEIIPQTPVLQPVAVCDIQVLSGDDWVFDQTLSLQRGLRPTSTTLQAATGLVYGTDALIDNYDGSGGLEYVYFPSVDAALAYWGDGLVQGWYIFDPGDLSMTLQSAGPGGFNIPVAARTEGNGRIMNLLALESNGDKKWAVVVSDDSSAYIESEGQQHSVQWDDSEGLLLGAGNWTASSGGSGPLDVIQPV